MDSLIAQLIKNLPGCRKPQFTFWARKICWRRDRLLTPVFLGFPCGSAGKESTCNVGDLGSILGLGRSPGEKKGYSLQYSGLENSMGCVAHGFAKSGTWLSDLQVYALSCFNDFLIHPLYPWRLPMAQWQRILLLLQGPQETWIISLSLEAPLEEEMAAHSNILTRIISTTE